MISSKNEIPNQYCDCDSCGPWFSVTTELGVFTLGWRKRVIHIKVGFRADLHSLFSKENVTIGSDFVHAWSWENACDYLSAIRTDQI